MTRASWDNLLLHISAHSSTRRNRNRGTVYNIYIYMFRKLDLHIKRRQSCMIILTLQQNNFLSFSTCLWTSSRRKRGPTTSDSVGRRGCRCRWHSARCLELQSKVLWQKWQKALPKKPSNPFVSFGTKTACSLLASSVGWVPNASKCFNMFKFTSTFKAYVTYVCILCIHTSLWTFLFDLKACYSGLTLTPLSRNQYQVWYDLAPAIWRQQMVTRCDKHCDKNDVMAM